MKNKKEIKSKLHPRNKHRQRYDLPKLTETCPELAAHIIVNKYGDKSINFFDPAAVKMLNKALLQHHYGIENWDIPENYLCPPIPGRADYIHHIADLLANSNGGKIPTGKTMKVLDIGTGASCIYPIIGNREYGWSFIGTEVDSVAMESATKIIQENIGIKRHIEIREQTNKKDIFYGMIQKDELFDLTICNPPFHSSLEAAKAGSLRKLKNLKGKKVKEVTLNFGGQSNELWCEGGEKMFIRAMIKESKRFAKSCFWFSTLVSKETTLKSIYKSLKKVEVAEVKTIEMGQGNKVSRIVAWTFLNPNQQEKWMNKNWRNYRK